MGEARLRLRLRLPPGQAQSARSRKMQVSRSPNPTAIALFICSGVRAQTVSPGLLYYSVEDEIHPICALPWAKLLRLNMRCILLYGEFKYEEPGNNTNRFRSRFVVRADAALSASMELRGKRLPHRPGKACALRSAYLNRDRRRTNSLCICPVCTSKASRFRRRSPPSRVHSKALYCSGIYLVCTVWEMTV